MAVSQTVPHDGTRPAQRNQRATVRYRCAPATAGKVYTSDDVEFQRAWVLNLSLGGVGLHVSKPLHPGLFITIQLKNAHGTRTYQMSGHVAHATQEAGGDWIIGCEFLNPLSREELDDILG